jgi:hypothetical protein
LLANVCCGFGDATLILKQPESGLLGHEQAQKWRNCNQYFMLVMQITENV